MQAWGRKTLLSKETVPRIAAGVRAAGIAVSLVLALAPAFAQERREPAETSPAVGPAPAETAAPAVPEPDPRALEPPPDVPPAGPAGFEPLPARIATDVAPSQGNSLDCIIEPHEVVEIRSPVTGLIQEIAVERGDPVEVGDVLVALESGVEIAAVELAHARATMAGEIEASAARLELGERKKSRAKRLYKGDALSTDQRQEAETEARVAALELQQARENQRLAALELERARAVLAQRTIESPIAGYVVSRSMSRGEVVDEETILTIAQIDPLRVEVILPSAMYGSIRPGTRAAVVPEQPGDRVHVASVAIVDPVIDAASGTFGVRLELPNPERAIPGGLRCQVRFLDD